MLLMESCKENVKKKKKEKKKKKKKKQDIYKCHIYLFTNDL